MNKEMKEQATNDAEQRYLRTQDEVAEYLGLTQVTVNKLVKNGEIKGKRVGNGDKRSRFKFPVAELDRCLLGRIKRSLGRNFTGGMFEAILVATVFQSIDVNWAALTPITTAVLDELRNRCPSKKLPSLEIAISLYKKLPKGVSVWLNNRLNQTARLGGEKVDDLAIVSEILDYVWNLERQTTAPDF